MNIETLLKDFPSVVGNESDADFVTRQLPAATWLLANAATLHQVLLTVRDANWLSSSDALALAAQHGIVVTREGLRKAARMGKLVVRRTSARQYQYDATSVAAWASDRVAHKRGRPRK